MSLSRQSSYETFVFSQPPSHKDGLQLADLLPLESYLDPTKLRRDLDINGLSEAVGKSWATLKPFQSSTSCFFNAVTPAIVNKIGDRVDECSAAIKTTLGAAQMGRAFAKNMADLYTLDKGHSETEAMIAKSIAIADKAYGRSIQAHGQLICVRTGLSGLAGKIPTQVAETERELKKENPDAYFNGMHHTVISVPKTISVSTSDEDGDTWTSGADINGWQTPGLPGGANSLDYLNFQSLVDRLNTVVTELTPFINCINSAALWWAKMKRSLEVYTSHSAVRLTLRQDAAEQWRSVADQYALYVYNTSPMVSGFPFQATRIPEYNSNTIPGGWAAPYPPSPYMGGCALPPPPPINPYTPPRRRCLRARSIDSRSDDGIKLEPTSEKPKKAPLWKRIVCLGMA